MKFNIQKPSFASLIIAIAMAITTAIIFAVLQNQKNELLPIYQILLISLLTGVISYPISRFAINQYVFSKVKLIFKTIHEIKTGSEKEEDQIARKTSLEKVEKEVMEWAEERRSEIAELKVRETYRREFIGNVSHELKTPIFNIQGYILTLIDGGIEDDNINLKYLKRASKSVDRLINLVQDMDTLNKLESGILEIRKSEFVIEQLILDVIDMLEDSAKKRKSKIEFVNKLPKKDVQVSADPSRIEQVLVNLITNALKYGGKEKGNVKVSMFDMEDRILVEIADNGMGIPEADINRIFERFYRVDKSRTRDAGGSGLGLSIVKHIMDSHLETINVQSTVNVGSTFSFTLKKA